MKILHHIRNKNILNGKGRLLKLMYKNTFSWNKILIYMVLVTHVFKDCLVTFGDKEVYIFTCLSAELLAILQQCPVRKHVDVNDVQSLINIYGLDHALVCFWTDKGNARAMPQCLETSLLFKEISKEIHEARNFSEILFVEFESILRSCNTDKLSKQRLYKVDYKGKILGEKPFSLTRRSNKSKLKVSLRNWMKNEGRNIYPYTRGQDEFPLQVSGEQDNEGQSLVAFSNGALFQTLPNNQSSLNESSIPTERSERSVVKARYPEYINIHERIRSYARWTHRKPDPSQLSEAGFFFTDQGDLVRCFQCGIGLKDFSQEDNPLYEHVRNSSQCPFLLQYLGQTQLSRLLTELQMQDPELNRQRQLEISQSTCPELNYTVRHPEYQTFELRLKTYDKWPRHLIQTPRQLAEAGLYYTGFEDLVRCFACDGGLRRWDAEDEPWTEHCRWFPACPFVRAEKGDDFIALVQASSNYGNEKSNLLQENGEDLSSAMQQMTLRDPVYNAALNEHKDTCLEMGYQLEDFNEAVQEIRDRGTILPHIEEILDTIEVIKERKRQSLIEEKKQNETPVEENQRLKRLVICMVCGTNNVNALFLPCTHHRLCMTCAEPLTSCPVCERNIRQKIRTYLV